LRTLRNFAKFYILYSICHKAKKQKKNKQNFHEHGPVGAVYGLGFIGAAVYFISHATGFWVGVLGFLKASCLTGIPCLRAAKIFRHVINGNQQRMALEK